MSATVSALVTTKDRFLPSREDLLRAMQSAEKSPEAARYLRDQVHQIVEKSRHYNKDPEAKALAQQVLKAVDEFTQLVEYKFSQESQVWSGKPPKSTFDQMQTQIAKQAGAEISKKNFERIRFDYGINEEGHFVRGYGPTKKGDPALGDDTVESLDRLFNAWLANDHQVITREGYFLKKDETGKERQLTRNEVEALMEDSAKEFKEYLKRSGIETELVSQQKDYPGEHRLEDAKKKAAQERVEQVAEVQEIEQIEVEVERTTAPGASGGS
ncbi:hypothetical protein LEAN103870_06560 [Legionella anisa]|uniref:Substrate of the Dot/Icm secretion system n=1 Tax=Legionella anisa TaxID=28082 RepID=A0AAX0WTM7_9GAMM|nr:hypothetical protein [Legionella anisa]AWN75518.1 hypothetical protein DLD14_17690 [Legionella anisa]KTC76304.1 substrate of the Dot/Icm secretion system [Legionella anisa]MBN5937118.1 hypothetical protein [Legionella anisa]MCW8424292.1 hypothetical protein [Legionella anisa]MCW8446590.1 hypothetical protein [Legionella anisa]